MIESDVSGIFSGVTLKCAAPSDVMLYTADVGGYTLIFTHKYGGEDFRNVLHLTDCNLPVVVKRGSEEVFRGEVDFKTENSFLSQLENKPFFFRRYYKFQFTYGRPFGKYSAMWTPGGDADDIYGLALGAETIPMGMVNIYREGEHIVTLDFD